MDQEFEQSSLLHGLPHSVPRLPLQAIDLNVFPGKTPADAVPKPLEAAAKHDFSQQKFGQVVVSLKQVAAWPSGLHGESRTSSPSRSSNDVPYSDTGSHAECCSNKTVSNTSKRDYRAGPRTYVVNRGKTRRLDTGDVVVFLDEDAAYTVVPFTGNRKSTSTPSFALQLSRDSHPLSDKSCHLEVVRKDGYIGFRSAAASDKFLQVRRHGEHRLVFYNSNFGVWEQWELVNGQPSVPWNRMRLELRNRQLQQVIIAVDVMRVGAYAVSPDSNLTPRSLTAVDMAKLDVAELQKMGDIMIAEWFHFVNNEKQARVRIDAKVNDLLDEAQEIKDWVQHEVHGLQAQLEAELCNLNEMVVERNLRIAETEQRLTHQLRWGVLKLQRQAEMQMGRQVLHWWWRVAQHQRNTRRAVSRHQGRMSQLRMKSIIVAWHQHTATKLSLTLRFQAVVTRRILLRMLCTFRAWRDATNDSVVLVDLQVKKADQAARCFKKRRLALLFSAWHCAFCEAQEVQKRAVGLLCAIRSRKVATIFMCWQQFCLDRQRHREIIMIGLDVYTTRLIRTALQSWTIHVAVVRETRIKIEAWKMKREMLKLRMSLRFWQQYTQQKSWENRMIRSMADRRSSRMLSLVLCTWSSYIQLKAGQNKLVAFMQTQRTRSLLSGIVLEWHGRTLDKKATSHKVQFFRNKHLARLAMSALAEWRYLIENRKAGEKVILRMCKQKEFKLVASSFYAIQLAVHLTKAAEQSATELADRKARILQANILRGWQGAAQESAVACDRIIKLQTFRRWASNVRDADIAKTRLLDYVDRQAHVRMQNTLSAWRMVVDHRLLLKLKFRNTVSMVADTKMSWAFSAWQTFVDARHAQQRKTQRAMTFAQRNCLRRAWKSFAAHQAFQYEKRQFSAALVARLARRRLSICFKSWQMAVVERKELSGVVQNMVRSANDRRLTAAFSCWVEYARRSNHNRVMVRHAAELAHTRLKRFVFEVWWQHHESQKAWGARLAQVGTRRRIEILRLTISSWKGAAAELRVKRQVVQETKAMLEYGTTARTFLAWRTAVQHLSAGRAAVHRLISWNLGEAFNLWRAHTSFLRAFSALKARVNRNRNAFISRLTLQGWRSVVLSRKAALKKLEHVAHDFLWPPSIPRYIRNPSDVPTWHFAQKLAVFAGWLEYVKECRWHRLIIARAVAKRQICLLQITLTSWQNLTVNMQQRRKLANELADDKVQVFRLQAFNRWKSAWKESKGTRETVDACVTRRRIAFNMFRQHYWEHMEGGLQDALRNFCQIAEATINTPGPAPNPYKTYPRLASQISSEKAGQDKQKLVPQPLSRLTIMPELQSPLSTRAGYLRLGPSGLAASVTGQSPCNVQLGTPVGKGFQLSLENALEQLRSYGDTPGPGIVESLVKLQMVGGSIAHTATPLSLLQLLDPPTQAGAPDSVSNSSSAVPCPCSDEQQSVADQRCLLDPLVRSEGTLGHVEIARQPLLDKESPMLGKPLIPDRLELLHPATAPQSTLEYPEAFTSPLIPGAASIAWTGHVNGTAVATGEEYSAAHGSSIEKQPQPSWNDNAAGPCQGHPHAEQISLSPVAAGTSLATEEKAVCEHLYSRVAKSQKLCAADSDNDFMDNLLETVSDFAGSDFGCSEVDHLANTLELPGSLSTSPMCGSRPSSPGSEPEASHNQSVPPAAVVAETEARSWSDVSEARNSSQQPAATVPQAVDCGNGASSTPALQQVSLPNLITEASEYASANSQSRMTTTPWTQGQPSVSGPCRELTCIWDTQAISSDFASALKGGPKTLSALAEFQEATASVGASEPSHLEYHPHIVGPCRQETVPIDACYYTQPAVVANQLFVEDIPPSRECKSWHGAVVQTDCPSQKLDSSTSTKSFMSDNPLSEQMASSTAVTSDAHDLNAHCENCPDFLHQTFQAKLDAVATPLSPSTAKSLQEILEAHGSQERPVFNSVVKELNRHLVAQTPSPEGTDKMVTDKDESMSALPSLSFADLDHVNATRD